MCCDNKDQHVCTTPSKLPAWQHAVYSRNHRLFGILHDERSQAAGLLSADRQYQYDDQYMCTRGQGSADLHQQFTLLVHS